MGDMAARVNLGTIGMHYVEGELTPHAAAEAERLGYAAVWIAGARQAHLTIAERVLAATDTPAVATGIVNLWNVNARAVTDTYHRLEPPTQAVSARYPRGAP